MLSFIYQQYLLSSFVHFLTGLFPLLLFNILSYSQIQNINVIQMVSSDFSHSSVGSLFTLVIVSLLCISCSISGNSVCQCLLLHLELFKLYSVIACVYILLFSASGSRFSGLSLHNKLNFLHVSNRDSFHLHLYISILFQ